MNLPRQSALRHPRFIAHEQSRKEREALHDQPRRDQGHLRALDPAATEALLSLRRLHSQLTLSAPPQELLRQGVLQPGTFSYSTLQRRLAQAGLDRRSLRAGAALLSGPTKAFEPKPAPVSFSPLASDVNAALNVGV